MNFLVIVILFNAIFYCNAYNSLEKNYWDALVRNYGILSPSGYRNRFQSNTFNGNANFIPNQRNHGRIRIRFYNGRPFRVNELPTSFEQNKLRRMVPNSAETSSLNRIFSRKFYL